MALFRYQARDKDGKLITNSQEFANREVVVAYLREHNLFPISIEEVKPQAKRFEAIQVHLKDKEIVFLTRQLSNLLDSGIPLTRSLDILVNQIKNPKIKEVIAKISDQVSRGGFFWEALSKHPDIFSRIYIGTIKAGEMGAGLEKVVKNLADFLEKRREIRDSLISMLIYPVILLLVGLTTIVFLMAFVIPKMMFIFSEANQSLPLITKGLIAASIFLSKYWWVLVFILLSAIFVFKRLCHQKQFGSRIEQLLYKFPLVGSTLQKIIFARFTRVLGLVLSNGVSILESLDIARGVVQSQSIAKSLDKVYLEVSQGNSLSKSLLGVGVFSPIMIDMVSVGEETGHLEEALLKIAEIYDRESQEEAKRLLSLLEPLLIFLLALWVGILVVAMLLPIFQMNLQVL